MVSVFERRYMNITRLGPGDYKLNFKDCKHNKGFYKGQNYDRCKLCHAARSLCMKGKINYKLLHEKSLEEAKILLADNTAKAFVIERLNKELSLWKAMVGGLKAEVKLLSSSFKDGE